MVARRRGRRVGRSRSGLVGHERPMGWCHFVAALTVAVLCGGAIASPWGATARTSPAVTGTVPASTTTAPHARPEPVEAEAISEGRAVLLTTVGGSPSAVPAVAKAAYGRAAEIVNDAMHECHLNAEVLAGVGWVETANGTSGGSWLTETGDMAEPLFGPPSSGTDTDGGEVDESTVIDRGVGPLQFLPMLWLVHGVDSNGDGHRDPQNIDDAALSLGTFLCLGDVDLAEESTLRYALGRFNGVDSYADRVIAAGDFYRAHPSVIGGSATAEPSMVLEMTSAAGSPSPVSTPAVGAAPTSAAPSAMPTKSSAPSKSPVPTPIATSGSTSSTPPAAMSPAPAAGGTPASSGSASQTP